MWCKRIDVHYGFVWVAKKTGNRFLPSDPLFNSRRTKMQWSRDNALDKE
jgi:hypothetical protein